MTIEDREWQTIKEYVDWVFDKTSEDRKVMGSMYDNFVGEVWKEELLEQDDSRAFVNTFFSNVESSAPMITDSNPVVQVVPRWSYLSKLRDSYNKAFKYFWNIADMQMKLFMGTLDAQIMKVGIYEITYDQFNPFGADISVKNVDPRTFFLAHGYHEIWDAPICGTREVVPLSYIRRRFPNVKEITPTESIGGDVNAFKYGDSAYYDLENYFVQLYKVWIKDDETSQEILDEQGEKKKAKKLKYPNGKFMYFTPEQFLECSASPFVHGLPPYVEQWNYRVPHRFVGIGEGDQIIGLQRELNLNYQRVVKHAKRFHNPNILIDSSLGIDEDDIKEKYHQGGNAWVYDGFSAATRGGVAPITEIKGSPIDPSVTGLISLSRDVIESVSGMTDIAKGQVGKKDRQSATEIGVLTESAHTRTRQKVRNLEWTIKRIGYQALRNMQQYYLEPRSIYWKSDDGITYDTFGSNVAQVADVLAPSKSVSGRVMRILSNVDPELKKAYEMEEADYAKFVKAFAPNGIEEHQSDPVYFDFDIVVETNSTLPMDKQSLANLFVRLFQYKAIDAQALLERLQIPGWEDIVDRLHKEQERRAEMTGRPSSGPRQMPEQPGMEAQNVTQ